MSLSAPLGIAAARFYCCLCCSLVMIQKSRYWFVLAVAVFLLCALSFLVRGAMHARTQPGASSCALRASGKSVLLDAVISGIQGCVHGVAGCSYDAHQASACWFLVTTGQLHEVSTPGSSQSFAALSNIVW